MRQPKTTRPFEDPGEFRVGVGTVQCYIVRNTPWLMVHFGRANYDRNTPVYSDSLKSQIEPILAELNNGLISLDEALLHISKIWY